MDKKNVVMYILAVVVIVALILAGNSLSKNRELRDKNDTLEAANSELNAQLAAKDEELSALQASRKRRSPRRRRRIRQRWMRRIRPSPACRRSTLPSLRRCRRTATRRSRPRSRS